MHVLLFRAPCRTLLAVAALLAAGAAEAQPTTVVTYQGEITNSGVLANGNYDFRVVAYDAAVGGAQVGPIATANNIQVAGGRFTIPLDFGPSTSSANRYLEIATRTTGAPSYTVLQPRVLSTPAPLALALRFPLADVASSSGSMLSLNNVGGGPAVEFRSSSSFATAYFVNNGTGGTVRADTGSSGQGSAFTGYNYGVDRYAAELELVNSANPRAAIYARTAGNGQAIDAEVNANTNGDAMFARTTSSSASSYAGIFVGNVSISGNLAKSSGTFRIDHPLDPQNKTLSHSFVESPDMKNLYDGVATLDGAGQATITLPDWFEALNRDFRYQLTAIGAAAPNLHVAQEIAGNTFRVAGGVPNGRVSWLVTGIRHDAYARRFPTPVEEWKAPEERGRYIVPAAYDLPHGYAIDAATHPTRDATEPQ